MFNAWLFSLNSGVFLPLLVVSFPDFGLPAEDILIFSIVYGPDSPVFLLYALSKKLLPFIRVYLPVK